MANPLTAAADTLAKEQLRPTTTTLAPCPRTSRGRGEENQAQGGLAAAGEGGRPPPSMLHPTSVVGGRDADAVDGEVVGTAVGEEEGEAVDGEADGDAIDDEVDADAVDDDVVDNDAVDKEVGGVLSFFL